MRGQQAASQNPTRTVAVRVDGETGDLSAIKIDGFLINSLRDFPALTRESCSLSLSIGFAKYTVGQRRETAYICQIRQHLKQKNKIPGHFMDLCSGLRIHVIKK